VGWARRRPGKVAAAATCSGEGRLGREERADELWVGRRRVEDGATWLAVGPQPELTATGPKDAGARRGCDGEGAARRGKGKRRLYRGRADILATCGRTEAPQKRACPATADGPQGKPGIVRRRRALEVLSMRAAWGRSELRWEGARGPWKARGRLGCRGGRRWRAAGARRRARSRQ
jgi:hypothetical protein